MPKQKRTKQIFSADPGIRPALSPEAREQQLVSLAVDCAERQLREGTASSAVIVHYLKLGTVNAELEREKLRNENEVLRAKAGALKSAENSEKLFADAIKAFKKYSGNGGTSDESEDVF